MTAEPRRLTAVERRRAQLDLVLRYGDPYEQEAARTSTHFWIDPQRVVSQVALALHEEARTGRPRDGGAPVTGEDVEAALTAAVEARTAAELDELCLLHTARVRGVSWEQVAALLSSGISGGRITPDQARRRYAELKKRHPTDIILRASAAPLDTPTDAPAVP
ncbi:hypothetical protein ACFFV7_47345 [Nonomuraea spiralis]|uniref:Uncharacterized protein n=1 Tax=Nonomuraea spiralis TaxID=46182 RepID=A0ABV5IWK7_9ACTN|nr:hypothetical protein [Nonomuraea spiralis]GGT46617.1 hypothetical protein GCM10010176_107010 [Nonomuraea spiralis]